MQTKGKFLLVLLWTAFLNLFLYNKIGSGATALVFLGYFTLITAIFSGWKVKNIFWPLLGINLVFAWIMIGTSNIFPRILTFLTWSAMSGLSIYLYSNKSFFLDLEELFLAPINVSLSTVRSGFSLSSSVPKIQGWGRIIIGLIIGLFVVFILGILLTSGDPIFGKFISEMFSWKFWEKPIVHFIFSLFVLLGSLPLVGFKLKNYPFPPFPKKLPFVTEILVILILVAVLLGAFLIVQWPYVFVNVAAETSLSQFGVATYSEYVKKGFFEFILVAVSVYGLLWLGLGTLRHQKNSILIFVQTVLFGEFAIFLLSMFRRIYLYQNLHGWSLARIYGGIFLLWVTGLLVTLAIRHWRQKSLVFAEVLLSLGLVIFVGLFNAENFIVTTHPPTVNNRVDYVYLSNMSGDGYVGWNKAFDFTSTVLNKKYPTVINREERREIYYSGIILQNFMRNDWYIYDSNFDEIFTYNLAHRRALNEWKKFVPEHKVLDDLWNKYSDLMNRIRSQPQNEQDFDFDSSPYSPFL